MADLDDYQPIPTFKITDDLTRAAGVLQDMQSQGEFNDNEVLPNSPPALFNAGGPMLKQFDESTFASRIGSQAATPPQSVKGIGGKGRCLMSGNFGAHEQNKRRNSTHVSGLSSYHVGLMFPLRSGIKEDHTAQWFSHDNQSATESREQLAHDSLEMLIQWLKDGGNVGIHDATNSTRSRRASIEQRVSKEKSFLLIFLESICDDPALIAANVALKIRSGDPDYEGMAPEKAKQDFLTRIKAYEKVYETITEPHLSYLRIVNFNVEGKIGGDSSLSPRGLQYAKALPALDYQQAYPEDFANRDDDKFNYRYRGGESYRDVVVRLEPVIMELERQENILIIGHQAILRCLYAYFHYLPQADLPYIKIPLHTVIKLTPRAYGCDEERYALPIQAVDTHRPKPKGAELVIQASKGREYYTTLEGNANGSTA
ncbi:hypothetical protein C0991_002918 [Blastosporella zonata]|nr:hypothetical protein C0991_002918 [Blastosporella zonata]